MPPPSATSNLVDRKNATSWLDFGWEYLDVLNFGGQLAARRQPRRRHVVAAAARPVLPARRRDGDGSHAHARGLTVLLAVHFNNSDAPTRSAANICARTLEAKCDGVSLDFEVGDTRHNELQRPVRGYVARGAAARNLTVGVPTLYMDLPTNTGVDAAAIAAGASGGVVLMTYDYHWGSGNNGSSINTTLSFALAHAMPAASLLLGIAWYGSTRRSAPIIRRRPTCRRCGQTATPTRCR